MANIESNAGDRYLRFLLVMVVAVGFAMVVAVCLYRFQFGGDFAESSDKWSDFGGYVGGIFGPLVSFVTLLAVLKTVYMQRELLDAQKSEFEHMNALQQQTFESQLNQMTNAASDARVLQVSAAQDTAIKVVDQHISIYERVWDRHNESAYRFRDDEAQRSPLPDDQEFLDDILSHRNEARIAIDMLVQLSIELAVGDFRTPHLVRKSLALGLDKIRIDIKARRENNDDQVELG
ncbi:hypothetical protein [Pseudomonas viridiflava]|uniref:hypothetical protein n=1 Tax=Pseudomonas viridiflava TaxID=33069 RepID=UPI000F01BDBF|nr:hypothetical protein [Pseudomonas viridiflava]